MLNIILGLGWAYVALGNISGSQKISTHHYDAVAGHLDTNPVFCGILGSHLDISRITAVQGLSMNQCGTCLRISGDGKETYVMAVDKGGLGLDLNKESFTFLFGKDTGLFEAAWEPADPSNCVGIIKGGDYALPGLRVSPNRKPNYLQQATPQPPPVIPVIPAIPASIVQVPHERVTCSGLYQFRVTSNGISFNISCPVGKTCKENPTSAQCI